MIYFEIRTINDNKILAGNIKEFSEYLDFKKEKNQTIGKKKIKSGYQEFKKVSVWMIIDDEDDLYKSSGLFRRIMKAYGDCCNILFPYYSKKIIDHSHALRTIQGQMEQKIRGFARPKHFRGNSYEESKNNIDQIISSNTNITADTLCYLNKRIIDMDVHIGGFDVLYNDGKSIKKIRKKEANVKKVLQNIIAPFLEDLNEQSITTSFRLTDDYSLKNQIKLNYKVFHLAMYNFFNNVTKYTKPYSDVKIEFNKNSNNFEIKFEMMSYRIDKDEIAEIFKDGYCGRHASGCGDGIGMFVAKKVLDLINMDIIVCPNYSMTENINDENYIQNIFLITNK